MKTKDLLLTTLQYYFKQELLPETIEINDSTWMELYHLAATHNITPMLFQTLYHRNIPVLLKQKWKQDTFISITKQMQREHHFLALMELCSQANLEVLVVKGIICRYLYPNSDERPSNDEDLLVRKEDLEKVTQLFLNHGLIMVEDSEDVRTFHASSGLHLEVHTELFAEKSDAYGFFNTYFKDAFKNPSTYIINNVQIHTLSENDHLLFLIFHYIKHFLHGGVGIRQICDIAIFIIKHQDTLDFKFLHTTLDTLSFTCLMENTFAIASNIFPSLTEIIPLPKCDYTALLDDIMEAGVFGKSSLERVHSSTITLNAYRNQGNVSLRHSLFPKKDALSKRYPYLNKHPYLLPAAWFSRIVTYLKNDNSDSKVSITIGKQRVELLKQYRVIE